MKRLIVLTLGIALFFHAPRATAENAGGLLVSTGDQKLVIIHPDGTQELISENASGGAFSPDQKFLAFVVSQMQEDQAKGTWSCDCKLMVMTVATHTAREVVHLPPDAGFGQVAWTPDGTGIAYEIIVRDKGIEKSHDLILAPFPPERGVPRNLGHWYQGFSFSPDGKSIVHAVNLPSGLEVADVASGKRTLLHKANNIVWEAQFSPDGKFIAYIKTAKEPEKSAQDAADDTPDCTSPDRELRLYSLADGSDNPVVLHLPAPTSVYNFAWSPDSKRVALEAGNEDCTYPSGDAAVFVTTVDQKSQSMASTASPAMQPTFAPDGSAIAFVDSAHFPNSLILYNLSTRNRQPIKRAGSQENTYQLLGWK